MTHEYYSRDLMDEKFKAVDLRFSGQDTVLAKILVQTTKHNGRMAKMERILLIIGCVTATLLVVNGSSLVNFIWSLLK